MPILPKPVDQVTYLLVRCETDKDIEQIVGHIETIENDISTLTKLDVIDIKHVKKIDGDNDHPTILQP